MWITEFREKRNASLSQQKWLWAQACLLPACRWHWGSACWTCTVPAFGAPAWYSQFHPVGSGHAYVQFLQSTISEAHPVCNATASCRKAGSLWPTIKKIGSWMTPKCCRPTPMIWLVFFIGTTVSNRSLFPLPFIPLGWSTLKILILVLTLTHSGTSPCLCVYIFSPVKWENYTNIPLSEIRKNYFGYKALWKQ